MSLKDVINAAKTGLRILVATDKLGEAMTIQRENELAPICPVCEGTLQVGEEGSRVNCPRCVVIEEKPRACPTCRGTGKVGARGHQIACPVCG